MGIDDLAASLQALPAEVQVKVKVEEEHVPAPPVVAPLAVRDMTDLELSDLADALRVKFIEIGRRNGTIFGGLA